MTEYPWEPPSHKSFGSGQPDIPETPGLSRFNIEISWAGTYIDLNDGVTYKIGAETLSSSQVTWRKVMAESPITEGSYLVHAVRALVDESVQIYVYGQDQNELNENLAGLEAAFSQLDYRLRFTFDNYQEYWRCQPADWNVVRSHVMVHNVMAMFTAQVPRFPTVTREMEEW